MLSPRSVTFLALMVAAAAHPALLPPVYKRPVTSLSRTELEDVQPWIKFPFFGNVLESFPHFLPTIPEAGPKIENDSRKFQVIINVKEYNKKEFLKVKTKGSFIIIQGAHADVQTQQSSVDSQFIQTYTMPLKVIQSSITATLTSDGYLVVTAPIGSVINKITYNEKEIPIVESGLPLLEEKVVSAPTTPAPLILVTPSIELLPPKPTNDEAPNVAYLAPTIPAISLLPPKPISEENIPAVIPAVPTTELLPPKENNDQEVIEPIVIPVPSGQAENNAAANSNNENAEKPSEEEVVVPAIISIPLQPPTEGQQFIVGPTYAPITNVLNNDATQSVENVDSPTTEAIASLDEAIQEPVTNNAAAPEIATTEQALLYTSNDVYTSAPFQEQDNKIEDITEKAEKIQLRSEVFDDYTTETSAPQELGPADTIVNVLRSDITLEQESYTGEPEIIRTEEKVNEEESILAQEGLSPVTAVAEAANIIAATTEQQELLQKDDQSELIVESSTPSLVRSDLIQNEEINDSPTEINYIPAEYARSSNSQNIGAESAVEDSSLSENLPISNAVEATEKAISGDSLANIANVIYNDDLLINVPQTDLIESEPTISPENVTNKSDVSEN
ncbi:titin homolog [Aricia agestis]|uniref:titin homolog n=1 Tax=Aricia agestis TaxID=91739 RepID=UPI001C20197B|nr:titin homolog [Aricia agestis]